MASSKCSEAVGAATAGVPQPNVKVYPVQQGGGLGRKSPQDFTRQAVMIAKAMAGKPVKMLWTREEEIQHGLPFFYFEHLISDNQVTLGKISIRVEEVDRRKFPKVKFFSYLIDECLSL